MKKFLSLLVILALPFLVNASIWETVTFSPSDFELGKYNSPASDSIETNCLNKKKIATSTPFVAEGKTWWYSCKEDAYKPTEDLTTAEFGLRIGTSEIVNGNEWHKVFVCLHNSCCKTSETWTALDENDGFVGYIREENGRVYAIPDINWNSNPKVSFVEIDSPFIDFDNDSILILDFASSDSTFTIGNLNSDKLSSKWTMTSTKDGNITSNGYTYRCRYATNRYMPDKPICFVEGIGAVENKPTHAPHLFISPFYMLKPGIGNNYASLRYVTDSENNIIFESQGGRKIWSEYTGINKIEADTTDAPAEYYNLQGVRVQNPDHGLYIVRQGSTVSKVLVK